MSRRRLRSTLSRYAAEFAIVLVGVFLALWADQWRESRSREAESRSALHRIAANLAGDTLILRRYEFTSTRGVAAVDSILNADPDGPETIRLITRLTPFIVGTYVFMPASQEYEALRSSGRLGLITSSRLLADLAAYHGWIAYLERLAQMDFEQNRIIARLMYPHIEFPRDRFANPADSAAFLPTPTVFPSAVGLLDDRSFVNEMGQLGTLRQLGASTAVRLIAAADTLLRAIDEEVR